MQIVKEIHPGEHLSEMLGELGISEQGLAKEVGVPSVWINDIVHSRRYIIVDTALRIGRVFATSAEFWLSLQRMYELDVTRPSRGVSGI